MARGVRLLEPSQLEPTEVADGVMAELSTTGASMAQDSIWSRDCFEHDLGMFGGNAKQHARCAAGLPPALLPILQGGRTYAQHPGEFGLAWFQVGPDNIGADGVTGPSMSGIRLLMTRRSAAR